MLTIFGGRVKDLETVLLEEQLPEGWQSRVRSQLGLTFSTFNLTAVWWVELWADMKKYQAERAAKEGAAKANNES
jgi:hypothetical protein